MVTIVTIVTSAGQPGPLDAPPHRPAVGRFAPEPAAAAVPPLEGPQLVTDGPALGELADLQVERLGEDGAHDGITALGAGLESVQSLLDGQPPAAGIQLLPAGEQPRQRRRVAIAALDSGHARQARVGLP